MVIKINFFEFDYAEHYHGGDVKTHDVAMFVRPLTMPTFEVVGHVPQLIGECRLKD